MRGGLVFFRGAGGEARAYLESDHSHADEYYLENGGAVAEWTAWDGAGAPLSRAQLGGDTYQAWVDWKDPETGAQRGTPRDEVRVRDNGELRITPSSPRFVEMTVNSDKSLSVAAALSSAVSVALDQAQAAASTAMNRYMAENSVTRVGPRGAQRFVPVERLESVTVVHRSSRAGDPHRHVHVQWSTRVLAEGKWRALHTAATLKQQGALRGVGEAAINSHAGLRVALAAEGFEFDAGTGKVTNLEQQARAMSKRATQIDRNVSRFETEWREQHPGQEPDRGLRRQWDQQAWAYERPRKKNANIGSESKWIDELRDAGMQIDGFRPVDLAEPETLEQLPREQLAAEAIAAAEGRGSAWSIADLEGHIGSAVAARGVHAQPDELNAFLRHAALEVAGQLPALEIDIAGDIPSWVRNITSERVLRVERDLRERFTERGLRSGLVFDDTQPVITGLNAEQSQAARALASRAPLVVVEGAAGSGKTTMLGAARELAAAEGMHLVVVAPTLRAAGEAAAATGATASSAHKLAHEYGFRWTKDGRWSRLTHGQVDHATGAIYDGPTDRFRLGRDVRIVIDEAGMVDQDLAHAITTIAEETGARIGMIGDRAQLPAVGRGGVLDMAIGAHPRPLDMSEVHRFREAGYAELSLRLRDRAEPGKVFDDLAAGGHIVLHPSDAAAWGTISKDVVAKAEAGATIAVAVPSNDAAAEINALVQGARARAGHTRKPSVDVAGVDGLTLRTGDRLMTRKNDSQFGVANRDTWDVTRVHRDQSVTVTDGARKIRLPLDYVEEHTHLAYAATEYGVQGATVDFGHGVVTESSSAQALYVAATRGREHNALHVVAGDMDEARVMFTDAMRRESGDRGVEAARTAIGRDLDGIVLPQQPGYDPDVRAARLAGEQRILDSQLRDWEAVRTAWAGRNPQLQPTQYESVLRDAEQAVERATMERAAEEHEVSATAVQAAEVAWHGDFATVQRAEAAAASANPLRRRGLEGERDMARRAFQARHGAAPAAAVPADRRARWARDAIAPGANPQLDALRRREAEARRRVDQLHRDPVPAGAKPELPVPGTPAQEAAKDAVYRSRQDAAAQRNEQDRRRDRTRDTTPQRAPEL